MSLPKMELHRYHRYPEPDGPTKPRVRLPKMVGRFVRVAELLRVAADEVTADLSQCHVYSRMARRGVFDSAIHFERFKGVVRPTPEAQALMAAARSYCQDWGLLEVDGRRCTITLDGRATLEDWDNPDADAIYGNTR